MDRTRMHALVAAWVLNLAAAAPPGDPTEDKVHLTVVVKWGGRVTHDEYVDTRPITEINLNESKALTDAGLAEIGRLRSLRKLDLNGVGTISDAGIKALKEVKSLRGAAPHKHARLGRRVEGPRGPPLPPGARPRRHRRDGRGGEDAERVPQARDAAARQHQGHGRGAEAARNAQDALVAEPHPH